MEKRIANLKMYPFETTLMGVLKGVVDYFDIPVSDAWLFGGSGHAFLINIHEQLCPSSPYCWKYETFFKLVANFGISIKDLGFFSAENGPDERRKVEEYLKRSIDAGTPCSLLNMENQLISGYNDTNFIVEKPWPKVDLPFTPKALTFQTWKELGDEVHVNFFTFAKVVATDDKTAINESLDCAVDMTRNPERYRLEHYYIGLEAYDAWVKAVKDGYGASHGNWWNGTVWRECREMASRYFMEIAQKYPGKASEKAAELGKQYEKLAKLLDMARDRKLEDNKKIEMLQEARKIEESCVNKIEEFLKTLKP